MAQSVSPQIDLLELFIKVQGEESCSLQVQSSSLVMSSLRRRIIKRSRRLCSTGYFMMTLTWNKILRMSQSWVSTITFQISPLLLIDSDPVFKSLMSFQRISQLFSMRNSTSLTQIWFQRRWTFTKLLEWSMNLSLWSHLSLKLPCQLFKLLFSLQLWKSFLLQVWTYMTLMNSLRVKRLRWPS